MPYRELNTPQPLRAVMRNHTTSGVETHREIIKRRRTRRALCRSTRRSAFENLQVTDLRASPCVSRFAAFFIGTRAETSTAESVKCLATEAVAHKRFKECHHKIWPREACASGTPVRIYKRIYNNSANDPSAGSPTETLLRLLLPLSDKVHSSFHAETRNWTWRGPKYSPDHSIGRSDGRCVQRAGT